MAFEKMGNFSFNHANQADELNLPADEAKAKFDSRANELKTAFNKVVDLLNATTDGASGADNVGATAIDGVTGTTVQTQMESMKGLVDGKAASGHNHDSSYAPASHNHDSSYAPTNLAGEGRTTETVKGNADDLANHLVEHTQLVIASLPAHYERDIAWGKKSSSNTVLQSPNSLTVNINNSGYRITSQAELNLATASNWDATSPTNYTTAANRAGKNFYVYACQPESGSTPVLKLSANSTVPSGYTAENSRKIAGFHCLCVAVGTISGHPLSGYVAGDIVPASVWDLKHRPKCNPEGMVYSEAADIWVDIYLQSGTGASTASVYGATITDTRNWMDFVDDGGAVKKQLLTDTEFQLIAAGSNEGTNITDSADPGTTGGHIDTNSRRMISNIGCEDCCGVMWQWLNENGYQHDADTWAWKDVTGGKGQLYVQGTYGDVKLLAGASWARGAYSGSRSRCADDYRWYAASNVGCRLRAEPA